MTEYADWQFDVDDRIATITLNRPAQRNSLTPDTFYELRDIAERVRADRDVWAIIVQGQGEDFSVGMDVSFIASTAAWDREQFGNHIRELQACLDALAALEKPTIAKLAGYCLGGGLLLALCCDFRVASDRTVLGFPEVKRGIAVILGTQRVTQIAGAAATKEMILLAELFDARTALARELVHQIVPPAELDQTVAALATKFRTLPPRTVAIAKRIIDEGSALSLRASQDLEIALQAELLGSDDFKEAVASFFEKRQPRFTGT